MNVYVVQFDVAWEDKTANFARVRQLLDAAAPASGSLIVLPEMFSTGFSLTVAATRQGEPPEGELFLAALARDFGSAVVGGVVSSSSGRPRNESVAFAPDGRLLARYAKIHPFGAADEGAHYAAGDEVVTFEWGGFTVAPFICYDLRFPEVFRAAADCGATLFTVIAQWPARRVAHWQTLLPARAIENQAFVVGANRCGRDPQHAYSGRSCVVDPHGVVIADAGEFEGVLSTIVEPSVVARWREDFPALRDRRWNPAQTQPARA